MYYLFGIMHLKRIFDNYIPKIEINIPLFIKTLVS